MIDTQTETVLTLSQAARSLPGRNGQGVHVSTTWRWTLRGIRGVLLETILIGGIRYTSQEALQRFFVATTAAANGTAVPVRTTAQRQKAIEAAERELGAAGICVIESNPPQKSASEYETFSVTRKERSKCRSTRSAS